MTIYIVAILLLSITGIIFNVNKSSTSRKVYLIFAFLVLAFIAGLRSYYVGSDTKQYWDAYTRIGKMSWAQSINVRYEFGFFALCKILFMINPYPQLLTLVTSCFISFAVCVFVYFNSRNIVQSVFLYITLTIFTNYMNIMRQAIAIGIILIGLEFLKRKRLRNYAIYATFVFVATQFHSSALIMILVLVFAKIKYSRKIMRIMLAVTAMVFVAHGVIFRVVEIVLPRYMAYVGSKNDFTNYFAAVIEAAMCVGFLLMGVLLRGRDDNAKREEREIQFDRTRKIKPLDYDLMAWLMSFAVFFMVITVKSNIFLRTAEYFRCFYFVWIPNALFSIQNNKNRTFLTYVVMIVAVLYFIIVETVRPEWHQAIPYEFYWHSPF